jgi:hypothetical protein
MSNTKTLQALVKTWRAEADSVTAAGYSQQGDRLRDCADELEDALDETPSREDMEQAIHIAIGIGITSMLNPDWPREERLASLNKARRLLKLDAPKVDTITLEDVGVRSSLTSWLGSTEEK